MKIISYESKSGSKSDLHFPKILFDDINLIVGGSATGKTRLLNTIFNGARMAVRKEHFFTGWWNITCEHESKRYRWEIETIAEDGGEEAKVLKETIAVIDENGTEEILLSRKEGLFSFKGDKLPKIAPKESGISLFRDEDDIRPLYDAFKLIMRRSFSGPELDQACAYIVVPQPLIKKIAKSKNIDDLFSSVLSLNGTLYILDRYFNDIFTFVSREFMNVFPFVSEIKMQNAAHFGMNFPGIVPIFSIKEHYQNDWIPLDQLSSGMKKVLLILTDICIMPRRGGIYIIDEYENSLGVNAINFFPNILFETNNSTQFIITSHHPYIIGNISPEKWIVLHRKGNKVKVMQGNEFANKFSKSKQQAFIQLINEEFYAEGVE
jgi:predicted ATPase